MSEIIYVCKSKNNKNVRENELKILRKSENVEFCFEFGTDENNLKKRFYDNKDFFEHDFKELSKIKKNLDSGKSLQKNDKVEEDSKPVEVEIKEDKPIEKEIKFNKHKRGKINLSQK